MCCQARPRKPVTFDFEHAASKDGDNDDADKTNQVGDWETGEDGQVGVSVQHG